MKVINIRGVDRLEFGLDIEDYAKEYKPILIELEEKKAEGQLESKMQKIEFNNILFDVGMTGAKFYRYRTICKDFMMLFSGKAVKEISKEIPVIRTILYSGYLWSYGYQEAYYNYLKWLSYFPGSIEKTRLSRLDICLDTDEVEFDEEDKEKFITRAKSKTTHYVDESYSMGNKFSGFTIGRGKPMLVRIYNKTLEMQANNKEWLKHTWKENGWDRKKAVWRIEFQLRREALKELGIDQVEDLFGNEERLWHYLTQWLRMDSEKWEIIKRTNTPIITPMIREKVKMGNYKRLLNQAIGILIAIGASMNECNLLEILEAIKEETQKKMEKEDKQFANEVRKRRASYTLEDYT